MLRTLLLLVAFVSALAAGEAENLARKAAHAARGGDYVRAFSLYSQAAQLSPYGTYDQQSRAMLAAAAANEQVRLAGTSPDIQSTSAAGEANRVASLLSRIDPQTLAATRQPLPPIKLEASSAVHDLDVTAPPKKLWESVLSQYGLEAVFDESVTDTPASHLELSGTAYRDAIRALELVTNTMAIPVARNLLLVAANNPNTQTQFEPVAAVAIPLPQVIANEDATEIGNAVRQALEIKTVMVDGSRRLLLIRDRYSKVLAAQALTSDLLEHPQNVVLEVEFREVSRRSLTRFGISPPTSFPLQLFTTWLNNRINPVAGFANYLTFGGGASLVGIGIASSQAVAFMNRSDSETIYRGELRAGSGKESDLRLGQEYPILRSTFLSGPVQTPGSSVFFPQVDFKQIGFEVKATPFVWQDTVTLDLNLTVALLTGESANGIPVLSNREIKTRIQLEDGQMIVVAGLLHREEARNLSGLAGLQHLPGIGALFRQTSNSSEDSEVLITLRPYVLDGRPSRAASRGWWTGASTRFLAPL